MVQSQHALSVTFSLTVLLAIFVKVDSVNLVSKFVLIFFNLFLCNFCKGLDYSFCLVDFLLFVWLFIRKIIKKYYSYVCSSEIISLLLDRTRYLYLVVKNVS